MSSRARVRAMVGMALIAATSSVVACAPESPPPAYLDVLTQLTWCGGVQPPPGEPACHTSPRSASIEIRQKHDVVATGTTGVDGHLLVAVPPGVGVRVSVVDPPVYEQCDEPTASTDAGSTTVVVQTCTVFAP